MYISKGGKNKLHKGAIPTKVCGYILKLMLITVMYVYVYICVLS